LSALLTLEPLTREAFAPYGDVIEVSGEPDKLINQGMCGRFHDLAKLDFGSGRAGISLFDAQARHFPYTLDMMERHPEGSQAFIPLSGVPMIISVAKDNLANPDSQEPFSQNLINPSTYIAIRGTVSWPLLNAQANTL